MSAFFDYLINKSKHSAKKAAMQEVIATNVSPLPRYAKIPPTIKPQMLEIM